jgi:exodeoxyribonuclease VII small subunit
MGTAEHEGDAASRPAVEEMTYTAASAELDEIVRFFEQREVDVDQLVARLVRATAIIEELDSRLRRTRVQVEELVPRLSAVLGGSPAGEPVHGAAGEAASKDVDVPEGMEDVDVPEGMEDVDVPEGMTSTNTSDGPGAPDHPGLF